MNVISNDRVDSVSRIAFRRLGAPLAGILLAALLTGACAASEPIQTGPKLEDRPVFKPDFQVANCPPDSFRWTNNSGNRQTITYVCSGSSAVTRDVEPGKSLVFDGDGDEHCSGCDQGDANCECINCPLTRLVKDPGVVIFECEMVEAYWRAYGLDLGAEGFVFAEEPEPIYLENGDVLLTQHWTIPIVGENGDLIGWEYTTIKPHFSVEDGEVVIRDSRGRIVGGRAGITLDDR